MNLENGKIKDFCKEVCNKKIAVLGLGKSNIALLEFLSSLSILDITVIDKRLELEMEAELQYLGKIGIKQYNLGVRYLENLHLYDMIFRSPGVNFNTPELQEAKKKGVIITSEIELFMKLCSAEIYGITGSDGKTTTSTIIYEMLKEQGFICWLGGNIGIPLINKLNQIDKSHKVVLELSSFQLNNITISPDVAVITNITPNHLDIHNSMEEYIEAKKNIFKFQNEFTGTVILNYDNEVTRKFSKEIKTKYMFFSRLHTNEITRGIIAKDNIIEYFDSKSNDFKSVKIMDENDILIPGDHNVENYMAAVAALLGRVDMKNMQKVASWFSGVQHRIEFVAKCNDVKFYNDSVASTPARTIAGIKTFDQKLILIAGGYDKKIPYDDFGKQEILDRFKCLILLGETANKIEEAVTSSLYYKAQKVHFPIYKCSTLSEAIELAYENAKKNDIVLFSPASASFDMFKNFEERGQVFKELVKNIVMSGS